MRRESRKKRRGEKWYGRGVKGKGERGKEKKKNLVKGGVVGREKEEGMGERG